MTTIGVHERNEKQIAMRARLRPVLPKMNSKVTMKCRSMRTRVKVQTLTPLSARLPLREFAYILEISQNL